MTPSLSLKALFEASSAFRARGHRGKLSSLGDVGGEQRDSTGGCGTARVWRRCALLRHSHTSPSTHALPLRPPPAARALWLPLAASGAGALCAWGPCVRVSTTFAHTHPPLPAHAPSYPPLATYAHLADFNHTRCLLDAEVFLALKLKMAEDTQKGKTLSSHFLKAYRHVARNSAFQVRR